MHSVSKLSLVLVAAALTLTPLHARADVPPPDLCSTEGAACNNAGPQGDMPGTCTASQCRHPNPDGGVFYTDCLLCKPTADSGGAAGGENAGAGGVELGGSGNAATGGGGAGSGHGGASMAAGASGTPSSNDDGGCSCRLSAAGKERALAGLMLITGLLALRRSRRRPSEP